jgi:hypothetical protein
MKKKKQRAQIVEQNTLKIDQQKKDRVAAILAVVLGLVSIREGGSVLLHVTTPSYPILPWLVWYNVVMGFVSVIAGAGMWKRKEWGITQSVNILTLHSIVFFGLIGLRQFGQTVAMISMFAMLFRTFTWIVIVSLLKWKRQAIEGNR